MEIITREEAARRLGWGENTLRSLEKRGFIRRVATARPGSRNACVAFVWEHLLEDLERCGSDRRAFD
ncbi:MAG: hypothetical protein ACYC3G_00690 [Minisyncoccota bacterium]